MTETKTITLQSGATAEIYPFLTYGASRSIKAVWAELYDLVVEAGGDPPVGIELTKAAAAAGVPVVKVETLLHTMNVERVQRSVASWSFDEPITAEGMETMPADDVEELFTLIANEYKEPDTEDLEKP